MADVVSEVALARDNISLFEITSAFQLIYLDEDSAVPNLNGLEYFPKANTPGKKANFALAGDSQADWSIKQFFKIVNRPKAGRFNHAANSKVEGCDARVNVLDVPSFEILESGFLASGKLLPFSFVCAILQAQLLSLE
jgi:hypothetical protein